MLYAIISVIAIIADQLMKYWVTANIPLNTGVVKVIPGIFHLVNIHNEGAAFSILSGWRWAFVVLAVAFSVLVIIAVSKNWIETSFGKWMAILTMAGAIGNLIDRFMYGYVVDMFTIPCIKVIQIFNIADLFITFCGILFCISLFIPSKDNSSQETTDESEPDVEKPKKLRKRRKETDETDDVTVYTKPVKPNISNEDVEEDIKAYKAPETVSASPKPVVEEKPAYTPPKDDMDFTLEDILNEFK